MMCNDAKLLLHAYLDNELDAAQGVAIVRHMQSCNACATQYADHARLREGLAQPALYRHAPHALRERWMSPPADAAPAPAPRAARPRRAPIAFAAAAGFVGALLLATSLWVGTQHRSGTNELIGEAVSSHIRSMQAEHLMDVVSTDQHTVKPWFDGKLDFSPTVKDLAHEGFPLVGGRLDALEGHSVAALVYKRRLHVINLYQWPSTSAAAAEHASQWHGYNVIRWTAGGMRFVAVSDVNEGELERFVLAFRDDSVSPPMR